MASRNRRGQNRLVAVLVAVGSRSGCICRKFVVSCALRKLFGRQRSVQRSGMTEAKNDLATFPVWFSLTGDTQHSPYSWRCANVV
jgi:hypothetical protein